MSTTPSAIFKRLKQIAPSIHFDVKYELDPSFVWDGDGPDPRDEGYDAYDVDVSASAVVDGHMVHGIESLGGTYDRPGKHDPDIGGYLPQMLEEAVMDLRKKRLPASLAKEAKEAQAFLKTTLKTRYSQQRRRKR